MKETQHILLYNVTLLSLSVFSSSLWMGNLKTVFISQFEMKICNCLYTQQPWQAIYGEGQKNRAKALISSTHSIPGAFISRMEHTTDWCTLHGFFTHVDICVVTTHSSFLSVLSAPLKQNKKTNTCSMESCIIIIEGWSYLRLLKLKGVLSVHCTPFSVHVSPIHTPDRIFCDLINLVMIVTSVLEWIDGRSPPLNDWQ